VSRLQPRRTVSATSRAGGAGVVSCGPVAIVLGSERPAHAISFLKPIAAWDSGFMVVYSDAPTPDELDQRDDDDLEDSELICLHCLLDDDPALGRGLDLAREHGGQVDLGENGEWVVVDLSRLGG
jgi:hypothetical protein